MKSAASTLPRPARAGEVLSLEIEKLVLHGRGLAHHQGIAVFVKDGLPGDRVQARVTRRKPNYAEATLLALERPSPQRVAAPCPQFGVCGGCDLQHFDYAAQVHWKQVQLVETLQHLGGIKQLPPVTVVSMTDPWHYRNKMEFAFGEQEGRIVVGLHQRGSFQRIVGLTHCWIAPPVASEILHVVEEQANGSGLPAYNPRRHDGFWRYMVVRVARSTGQALVLLVTNDGPREPVRQVAQTLARACPQVASVLWGVTTRVSDVAHPERTEVLVGGDVLEDRLGPLGVQVRPMTFLQPNLAQAELLYREMLAAAALTGREVVYDLYCGLGAIALLVAPQALRVYGVESDPENVALATATATRHGITNATFLCGTVEDLLVRRGLFRVGPAPDLVILDPPRVGVHPEVIAPLLHTQVPRLIYISCNPASLARDMQMILTREPRYAITRLMLFDFFPHTAHMEVLVTVER